MADNSRDQNSVKQEGEIVDIDIAKYFFACIIPLFNIAGADTVGIILSQYVARMGVPFFFIVTGMLIGKKLTNDTVRDRAIIKHQICRIGKMLLIWEAIYTPLQLISFISTDGIGFGLLLWIQRLIMVTPSYLWYLTASIVGLFLFLVLRNTRYSYIIAFILYIVGTLMNSYSSLLPSSSVLDWYYAVFLTSRNEIFFAFPLILLGTRISKGVSLSAKAAALLFGISYAALCFEITVVKSLVPNDTDTSMFFMLPIVLFL